MSITEIRRPGPTAAELTSALRGFTEVRHLELTYDLYTRHYALRLTVADRGTEKTQTLLCRNVQNLELNPDGGNFSQLLLLNIEDVRDQGLDGIHFTVDELEHGTLFLHCASLELA